MTSLSRSCLLMLALLTACYGRASPDTCHAKYVRDRPNPRGYERCMSSYRRRTGIPAPDPVHDAQVSELTRRYGPQIVQPECDGQVAPPGEMQSEIDGVAFQQPCGLVAFDFSGERFDTLVGTRCLGNLDEPCSKAIGDMFKARIVEKYPRADVGWISNHCTGYPEECDSYVELELQHLKTSNAAVYAAWNEEADRLLRQRQQFLQAQAAADQRAREERAEAQRQAWIEAMRVRESRRVTCTSTTHGTRSSYTFDATTQTSCH
jgi:hypothetical protein